MTRIYIFDWTAEGEDGHTVHGQMEMLSSLNVDAIQAIRKEIGMGVIITHCKMREDEDDAEVVEHIKAIVTGEETYDRPIKPPSFFDRARKFLAEPRKLPEEPLGMERLAELPAPQDMDAFEEVADL